MRLHAVINLLPPLATVGRYIPWWLGTTLPALVQSGAPGWPLRAAHCPLQTQVRPPLDTGGLLVDLSLLKHSSRITIFTGGGALQWIHLGKPKKDTLFVDGLRQVSVLSTSYAGCKRPRMLRVVTCRLRRTSQATAHLGDRLGFCPAPLGQTLSPKQTKRTTRKTEASAPTMPSRNFRAEPLKIERLLMRKSQPACSSAAGSSIARQCDGSHTTASWICDCASKREGTAECTK